MKNNKNNKSNNNKFIAECLSCSEIIFIGRIPKIGSVINCEYCDTEFVIRSLTPAAIDWPDYDFDDDYDYEDDGIYEYADEENDY